MNLSEAERIFNLALELPTEEQRAGYVAWACGSDPSMVEKVRRLLRAHEGAPDFLPTETGTAAWENCANETAGSTIGRYELLEKLGEGGFGVVWAAEQREPVRRRVALKIIKLGMDTRQVISRFGAERQALALMDHPNIATVLEAGATDTGRPYFVMELVRGIPITTYCDEKNLPTRDRLGLFIKVCHAIQHAHQKGIIHRDIKPSNILVTMIDGVPVPKIIDFGISKATHQELRESLHSTQAHQFIGTPAYMSPEQAEVGGLDVDTRSDIYSLGVLLYELLTGKTPFDAREFGDRGVDEVRRRIREEQPLLPSVRLSRELGSTSPRRYLASMAAALADKKLIQAMRGDLDWIVMKCLEKDRTRRYETANGLAADISRHLSNEPVVARPPSAIYGFRKAWRRNRLFFNAGAAVAAALVIGLGSATWLYSRERAARERAVLATQSALRESGLREQVAASLKEILGALGPSVAHGRDTKVLREKILDLAIDRIHRNLDQEPEVRAELLTTIAIVLEDLDDTLRAESMHREALRLRKALPGDAGPLIAESLKHLARVVRRRDRFDEAERLARQAVDIWRHGDRGFRLEKVDALGVLGRVLLGRGKVDEAERIHLEALQLCRDNLKPPHPALAGALSGLAAVRHRQGADEEAELLEQEALSLKRELFGSMHPEVADSLAQIGRTLYKREEFAAAERAIREAMSIHVQLFGWGHSETVGSMIDLATLLQWRGDAAGIASLLEDIRPVKETGDAFLRFRAGLYARRGRWEDAIADLRQAIELYPDDQSLYHCLAPLLVQTGDVEGYRLFCAQILSRFGQTREPGIAERIVKDCLILPDSGVDHATLRRLADLAVGHAELRGGLAWCQFAKALCQYRQGDYAGAVEQAQEALKESHTIRDLEAQMILAMAHHRLGEADHAREVYERGLEHAGTRVPRLESGDLHRDWLDWIIAQQLMREAKKLIEGPL